MPLTRHLYAEDEVIAALQFCILRGKAVEAVFWCEELIHSDMADQLLGALRQIWLYGFGIGALNWYRTFTSIAEKDELDVEELIGLVIALSRIGSKGRRDITYLILCGTTAEAEQANYCIAPKGIAGVEAYLLACIQQGRCISAWRALGHVDTQTLNLAAKEKHGDAGLEACSLLVEYPALAVAALCLLKGELAARLVEPLPGGLREVDQARSEWEPLLGRRSRRRFPIPRECLYFITQRGQTTVYETSEKLLRGSLERPGKLWGSTYWDATAEAFGGWEAIRNDAEQRMAFYDEHFPDDTPDEWSVAEREKSHGLGSLQPNTAPSAERFLRAWFGKLPSAVIWNGVDSACKGLANIKTWVDIRPISIPHAPLNLVLITRRIVSICG